MKIYLYQLKNHPGVDQLFQANYRKQGKKSIDRNEYISYIWLI